MKKQKSKRFDAWGHVILPHDVMYTYYQNDQRSVDLLRRFMPHRIVVLPDVEIRIDKLDKTEIFVWLIYPGETISKSYPCNNRILAALRKTYVGRKGWVRDATRPNSVIFRHRGRVIIDPSQKFAPRGN